ncbi:MAG: glycosyltransferase [Phycisphaeraceae bacterium]|nr:glycosyltransferase [Phycisphaeraceae bacterium]
MATILHISTRLILGGSQENTVLSCEGQARLGHAVHLAFGPIYGPEGSLLDRVESFNRACAEGTERVRTVGGLAPVRAAGDPATPIGIHIVPDLVRELSPVRDARCRRQLTALIRSLRPDIVHTHSSKAGILGRDAAWSVRLDAGVSRIIHTIHGPPFMPIEGTPLRRALIRAKNYIYTIAERHAARRCHAILSVADAMTREFLARRIGTPSLYRTVYSGMETHTFLHASPGHTRQEVRASLGLTAQEFVIGTVARLAEHKGHDDILDAIASDLRDNPSWRLLWVGDGWWRERLLARVRELGLDGRVIATGLVPPDRVPGLMRAMDILVHPSYREGLPRTVPQALLSGTPIVASDVDGTSEACLDPARVGESNSTGLLFPLGDRAKLREAILWMASHPAERAAMAARGRTLCETRFSAEAMVAQLERICFDR